MRDMVLWGLLSESLGTWIGLLIALVAIRYRAARRDQHIRGDQS